MVATRRALSQSYRWPGLWQLDLINIRAGSNCCIQISVCDGEAAEAGDGSVGMCRRVLRVARVNYNQRSHASASGGVWIRGRAADCEKSFAESNGAERNWSADVAGRHGIHNHVSLHRRIARIADVEQSDGHVSVERIIERRGVAGCKSSGIAHGDEFRAVHR